MDISYAPDKSGVNGTLFKVEDIKVPIADCYNGNTLIKNAGVKIPLSKDQVLEFLKCKKDCYYFIENYVRILSLNEGIVPFKLRSYQKTSINQFLNNRFCINLQARQNGKTTTAAAYLLWCAIFNKNDQCCVLANKEAQAIEILDRMRMMFEYLPFFMQPGVKEYNKKTIWFDNGSKIFCAATSSSSVRGKTISRLLCDEFAFVANDWDFYTSTYPVITSGDKTQVILISTPNGTKGVFYTLWKESELGLNDYSRVRVSWDMNESRDDGWKETTLKNIGASRFRQEFECISYDTNISTKYNGKDYKIKIGDLYAAFERSSRSNSGEKEFRDWIETQPREDDL